MTIAPPPLFAETKADDERPQEHTGAMIALRPRQDHIDRLAIQDGEEPRELHTTLLFLGKAADYSYDTRARIVYAMREIAQRFRQVTGQGFGVNVWNPAGEDPCVVLQVGGSEMVDIRNAVISALQGMDLMQVPEQHEPWVPHVTLKYTADFSVVPELTELAEGPVVYDAIRVAFGGIVDDIPFPLTDSSNDGYAGGNRYDGLKSLDFKRGGIKTPQKKAAFTPRVFVEDSPVLDTKTIRRVRTAAGVRRFGQPIGSVIVGDGTKLSNLKTVESEYDGFEKYQGPGGKSFYTRKEGSSFVAYDENDNVVGTAGKEDQLLKALDERQGSSKNSGRSTHRYDKFKDVQSEYDGYDKYMAPDGTAVYRDRKTNRYYDADDNELSDVKLRTLNGTASKPRSVPIEGLKEVESEYDGYDKYTTRVGTAIYRDQATGKYYDDKDREVNEDVVKRWAKPTSVDMTPKLSAAEYSGRSMTAAEAARQRVEDRERMRAQKPSGGGSPGPAPSAGATPSSVEELRSSLVNVDNIPDLDAVLDKVRPGNGTPSDVIQQIREFAKRARDARDRRKLNLFADKLSEAKIFAMLTKMDPWLHALTLETKLITPGGRVGSGASLSRSPKRNWIERTPVGRLPKYIRIVANGLKKNGHSTSRAIALAVAAMKRWARGGDRVRPQVQAAAAKALAEWEALKAAS